LPPLELAAPAETGSVTLEDGLAYAPTLRERRAETDALTLTDSFELEAPGGARLDVTLEMEVNACDLAAGDALDPGGVGFFRLPNELDVASARTACRAAVAAEPDEPRFLYQLGRAQQAAGAYEAAFDSFETAMEAGHVRAFNAVARLLTAPQVDRDLFDVPEDRARAFELLERGVAAADPFAMHLLGRFLLNDGSTEADRERGFELLDRAAELGHTYSMNELGIYFLSEGSQHFLPERGLRYLEASAARQDIYGYHNLGFVALYGLAGDEPDYAEARDWFEKAAEGGHPGSPATLGRMIVRGQIDAPAREAVRWYDLGLERGDPWGGVNAANMILNDEVSGFSAPEALVRAAKAMQLPGDEAVDRAREMLESAGPGELARAIQRLLNELGAGVAVDGLIGPATRAAIAAEAEAAGLGRPADDPISQLSTLAQAYWAANPIRSDVF
ncbi:MAG: peptidase C14, caspase catalytic subunit p20, partial [Deinococcus-Thermus bacterium]|nr:peptidase C14, caspase catalytic subunit p20 [Deinococcota bacterium]